MNLNDLANIGQVIGAIAVVISLIYVALQIRQNTNAVRSATAQSVHEHFASWYHLACRRRSNSLSSPRADCEIIIAFRRRRKRVSLRPSCHFSLTRKTRFTNGGRDCLRRRYGGAGNFDHESLRLRRVAKTSGKNADIYLAMNSADMSRRSYEKEPRTPTRNRLGAFSLGEEILARESHEHAKSGYHSSEIRRQK